MGAWGAGLYSGDFAANWSILIDPLTAIMLVVVTSVSSLVHLYSIGYMDEDPHKQRFMSYLSLFTFFMLLIYRIGYHVPIPGVDQSNFAALQQKQQLKKR